MEIYEWHEPRVEPSLGKCNTQAHKRKRKKAETIVSSGNIHELYFVRVRFMIHPQIAYHTQKDYR